MEVVIIQSYLPKKDVIRSGTHLALTLIDYYQF